LSIPIEHNPELLRNRQNHMSILHTRLQYTTHLMPQSHLCNPWRRTGKSRFFT
jgi:hypothetical protein